MNRMLWALALAAFVSCDAGQEIDGSAEPPRTWDTAFRPEIGIPAYPPGEGPLVLIDEGHNNFHTMEGTYMPFATFLERDGYVVRGSKGPFSAKTLEVCKVLVIADAMPRRLDDPYSTFSREEVRLLVEWVRGGGSLFLITDHLPDPLAVEKLARAFGVEVNNGYVLNGLPEGEERPILFRRSDGSLRDHPIVSGRNDSEKVETVATFAGCAFRAGKDLRPLLVFGKGRKSWMPGKPWTFPPDTPTIDVEGWCQGAVAEVGKGRIALFGEAAMFTAQRFGKERIPVGMNTPEGGQNARFLLNVMHWLSGIL